MWLLDDHGNFDRHEAIDTGREIPGETPPTALPNDEVITVRFGGYADGRGFSTGNRLRKMGFSGRLIAAGPLAPDQARHAFQSGFDAVLVEDDAAERQGERAWREAIKHSVGELYVSGIGSHGPERGIWRARHDH
ncbi:DUF934 domain-containing protein [Acuticoccus sp. M5D2P5]|uniref:DUF934 domain-containing protein n=1 Tax=Acuticoccus kalidii TaxID=2910977 RepID=UPI001F354117|nr:DUF934 domain-containing protein [Acuticoccus kalidii]MCF3932920.1 DUF934 domain-containing protein [Acuticoccus kalidii]